MKFNYQSLITSVAIDAELPRAEVAKCLRSLVKVTKNALDKDYKVPLPRLGSFKLNTRAYNTRYADKGKRYKVLVFLPSRAYKHHINKE